VRRALPAALALLCAATLLVAIPSADATSTSVDPARVFAKQIQALKRKTDVPILLPRALPGDPSQRLYASAWTVPRGWVLSLAGAPRCGGANACLLASFEGRRAGQLPRPANVRLPNGGRAYYKPITCGASCSPASLWFVHRGVLHAWQLKDPPPGGHAAVVRLAASAIAAGPR
jgi:hypothetical protein